MMNMQDKIRILGVCAEDQQWEELKRWYNDDPIRAAILFHSLTGDEDPREKLATLYPGCADAVCFLAAGMILRLANASMELRDHGESG